MARFFDCNFPSWQAGWCFAATPAALRTISDKCMRSESFHRRTSEQLTICNGEQCLLTGQGAFLRKKKQYVTVVTYRQSQSVQCVIGSIDF